MWFWKCGSLHEPTHSTDPTCQGGGNMSIGVGRVAKGNLDQKALVKSPALSGGQCKPPKDVRPGGTWGTER